MQRLSWHEYFMGQAKVVALRSTCARLAVGSLIVRDRRAIASGYNGAVSGDVHCIDVGCRLEGGHCVRCVHAETNAIVQCAKFGVSTEGADIYVTHFPCLNCTKLIIQAGIKNVFYEKEYRVDPYARQLLEHAGLQVRQVKCDLAAFLPVENGE